MANQEHLAKLKEGVGAWNAWRAQHRAVRPDLTQADLDGADLRGADLRSVMLTRARLVEAHLDEACLIESGLKGSMLSGAFLPGADLRLANLHGADLTEAHLMVSNLSGARLTDARLNGANLRLATLRSTSLGNANLARARLGGTTLADLDLSETMGLDLVEHTQPSTIGLDTIYRSRGRIPDVFLRGCGVPEGFITYMHSLVNAPLNYYSCFISHSSKDEDFAQRLHADLQAKGVRVWFAPEDMKIGDRIRPAIDDAIRVYDKLLIVLSEYSIASAWVETEVETAFEKERKHNKTVLFPIRLDNTVMDCTQPWAADIRRTRHIGDFTSWKDHDSYQKAFDRLLRDLKASEARDTQTQGTSPEEIQR